MIAALMEFTNALSAARSTAVCGTPAWDEALAAEETVIVPVQVNGRLRDRLAVPADVTQNEDELRARALAAAGVQRHVEGQEVARVIVVPGRLVNIVTQ